MESIRLKPRAGGWWLCDAVDDAEVVLPPLATSASVGMTGAGAETGGGKSSGAGFTPAERRGFGGSRGDGGGRGGSPDPP